MSSVLGVQVSDKHNSKNCTYHDLRIIAPKKENSLTTKIKLCQTCFNVNFSTVQKVLLFPLIIILHFP